MKSEAQFVGRTGWRRLGHIRWSYGAGGLREQCSRAHREKNHRPDCETQTAPRGREHYFACPGFANDFRTVTSLIGFSA